MADKETIISAGTRVSGEIRGEESILVRGRIDGRVTLTETLTVENGAIVEADIEVKVLVVAGVVVGNVTATDSVHLTEKARVVGDLNAPRVIIDAGAQYRGRVDMGEAGAPRAARAVAAATKAAPPKLAAPRMALPSTATAAPLKAPPPPARATAPAMPRVASAAPPSFPTPSASASGGPAWAKKKLRRR